MRIAASRIFVSLPLARTVLSSCAVVLALSAPALGCGPSQTTGARNPPRREVVPRTPPRAHPSRAQALAPVRKAFARVLARVKKYAKDQEKPLEKLLAPDIKTTPKGCQGEGYFLLHEIPTRADELPGFVLLAQHGQVPCGAVAMACLISAVQTPQGPALRAQELKIKVMGTKGDDVGLKWKRRAGCLIGTMTNTGQANCHSPGADVEAAELFVFRGGSLSSLLPEVVLSRSGGASDMVFKSTLKWVPPKSGKRPVLRIDDTNGDDLGNSLSTTRLFQLGAKCTLTKLASPKPVKRTAPQGDMPPDLSD